MEEAAKGLALLTFAAITPGPNNALVLTQSAAHGIRSAIPLIAVIAFAALVMAIATLGTAGVLLPHGAERWLSIGGGLLLLTLAVVAWRNAGSEDVLPISNPKGLAVVFAFQFLNPKGWLMMVLLAAHIPPRLGATVIVLLIVPLISGICLLLWALGGGAISRSLSTPDRRIIFDRAMAAVLALLAVLFII